MTPASAPGPAQSPGHINRPDTPRCLPTTKLRPSPAGLVRGTRREPFIELRNQGFGASRSLQARLRATTAIRVCAPFVWGTVGTVCGVADALHTCVSSGWEREIVWASAAGTATAFVGYRAATCGLERGAADVTKGTGIRTLEVARAGHAHHAAGTVRQVSGTAHFARAVAHAAAAGFGVGASMRRAE